MMVAAHMYRARVGKDYPWDKGNHMFGAKAIQFIPKEKRDAKWATPGQEAIWVGKSRVTPGADIVVPITWDGGSSRYMLGHTIVASGVIVDDTKYPLRSGPQQDNDKGDDTFDSFMEAFHHQMYGQDTSELTDYQIEGEDPIWEVESIVAKKNKGRKAKYLVKWVGSDI